MSKPTMEDLRSMLGVVTGERDAERSLHAQTKKRLDDALELLAKLAVEAEEISERMREAGKERDANLTTVISVHIDGIDDWTDADTTKLYRLFMQDRPDSVRARDVGESGR